MSLDPSYVKRIGLAVELEDGTLVQVYTEDCEGVKLNIQEGESAGFADWAGAVVREVRIPASITLSNLNSYEIQVTAPAPRREEALAEIDDFPTSTGSPAEQPAIEALEEPNP